MKIYIGVSKEDFILVLNNPVRWDGEWIEWIHVNPKIKNVCADINLFPSDIKEYILTRSGINPSVPGSIGELEI